MLRCFLAYCTTTFTQFQKTKICNHNFRVASYIQEIKLNFPRTNYDLLSVKDYKLNLADNLVIKDVG